MSKSESDQTSAIAKFVGFRRPKALTFDSFFEEDIGPALTAVVGSSPALRVLKPHLNNRIILANDLESDLQIFPEPDLQFRSERKVLLVSVCVEAYSFGLYLFSMVIYNPEVRVIVHDIFSTHWDFDDDWVFASRVSPEEGASLRYAIDLQQNTYCGNLDTLIQCYPEEAWSIVRETAIATKFLLRQS